MYIHKYVCVMNLNTSLFICTCTMLRVSTKLQGSSILEFGGQHDCQLSMS